MSEKNTNSITIEVPSGTAGGAVPFFQLQHTDPCSNARTGLITTDHGQIKTPIFMPVGTCGSVKGVHFSELREQVKAQIILGNTYHLYLRPTDSGGFQVFSLTGIRKLREEGCEFRSHIDGSKHIFTPENVMDTQRIIGADIIMALDECPPGQSDYQYAKNSLGLTQRWLDRCIRRFNESEPLYGHRQTLFPIVQGCTFKDLRSEAAKYVDSLGCFEMVLEHIPEELGTKITGMVNAVTIGIGGGKFTDGQVLVMHDALGMHQRKLPPFATKFVDMYSLGVEGFKKYIESVQSAGK